MSSTSKTKLLPVVTLDGIAIEYGAVKGEHVTALPDSANWLFRQDSNSTTSSAGGGLLKSVKFDLTGGPPETTTDTAGSASITSEVFNIAKNLLGTLRCLWPSNGGY